MALQPMAPREDERLSVNTAFMRINLGSRFRAEKNESPCPFAQQHMGRRAHQENTRLGLHEIRDRTNSVGQR